MPRSQYQYQPITGPVWREPVASRLTWLPAGREAAPRTLPPNSLGGSAAFSFVAAVAVATSLAWTPAPGQTTRPILPPNQISGVAVEPFTAALYKPEDLAWRFAPTQPARVSERAARDWTVLAPFQAPTFDPAAFPQSDTPRVVRPEVRDLGVIVVPFSAALYRPEGLQWLPSGARPTPTERRVLVDAIAPAFVALYRPDGLQWQPTEWSKPQRSLSRGAQTWSLLSPLPIPAVYDPRGLQFLPSAARFWPTERRILGEVVEPIQTTPASFVFRTAYTWLTPNERTALLTLSERTATLAMAERTATLDVSTQRTAVLVLGERTANLTPD